MDALGQRPLSAPQPVQYHFVGLHIAGWHSLVQIIARTTNEIDFNEVKPIGTNVVASIAGARNG